MVHLLLTMGWLSRDLRPIREEGPVDAPVPARLDSANTGWRNVSFRGYADYMQPRCLKTAWPVVLSWRRVSAWC